MNDPRVSRLADRLLDHSCRLQAGQNLLIEAVDLPDPALLCRLVAPGTELEFSIHLTPSNACDEADNGKSEPHPLGSGAHPAFRFTVEGNSGSTAN